MAIPPESFRGKVLLLMIDKLVIGAIIAIAFAAYDSWKTHADQKYQDESKKIQLDFERATLVKEFVPAINSNQTDLVTKAYLLRSAITTGAIDPDTAIDLGHTLVQSGLETSHFLRVMSAAMPGGIPAISRHSSQMAAEWRTIHRDQLSDNKNIPNDLKAEVLEAQLWRTVVLEAIPSIDDSFTPLHKRSELAKNIYGLFVIVKPVNYFDAIDLSHNSSHGIAMVGYLSRILFSSRDSEAVRKIADDLLISDTTNNDVAYKSALVQILADYGPPFGGEIAKPLAALLVQAPDLSTSLSVQSSVYSLQSHVAGLMDAMAIRDAKIKARLRRDPKAKPIEWEGIALAKDILLSKIQQFEKDIRLSSTQQQMELLSRKYSDDLLRRILILLGHIDSPDVRTALLSLRSVGDDKLRHFPFLTEDLDQALLEVSHVSTK
ncbi:MAG TPA: hypothetical protein VKT33_03795 [Candidatus Angelobacter sp.]|nr:hypothetical protein [Candidatus Angelobacter sp.]